MRGNRALNVSSLSSGYGKANVITDVSITVAPGSVTCILGANGAGKSTLIRAICGLNRVTGGEVSFGDVVLSSTAVHKIAALGIAVIPEGNRVFPQMTVMENLQVGSMLSRRRGVATADRLAYMFETFPRIKERRSQLAGTLSGGERSMLSIARGLMSDPELVIFDEPSLGLSPLFVTEVFNIVQRLRSEGLSILLVEQNVRQTLDVADYGYILSQGKVVGEGSTEMLKVSADVANAYFGKH